MVFMTILFCFCDLIFVFEIRSQNTVTFKFSRNNCLLFCSSRASFTPGNRDTFKTNLNIISSFTFENRNKIKIKRKIEHRVFRAKFEYRK